MAVFCVVVAFDQGSKAWARTLPTEPAGCTSAALAAMTCNGVPQPMIPGYWDWELAENTGAAFSSFAGRTAMQIVLALIAAGALVGIGIAAARTQPEQRIRRIGLALLGGGALGNLIDRIHHGSVTDFVRFRVGHHLWPIFNVADAALLIGVALLLYDGMIARRQSPSRLPA